MISNSSQLDAVFRRYTRKAIWPQFGLKAQQVRDARGRFTSEFISLEDNSEKEQAARRTLQEIADIKDVGVASKGWRMQVTLCK